MTPLTLVLLDLASASRQQQPEAHRAAERIQQAQYCAAIDARSQPREIERVQAVSRLEPELAAAQRRAELDRLVAPERVEAEQ